MLTATVELWPYGDQSQNKRLVTICIANVGTNNDRTHSYVWSIEEPKPLFGDPIIAQGKIYRYDRKSSCVEILAKVLEEYTLYGSRPLADDYIFTDYDKNAIESMRNKTRN